MNPERSQFVLWTAIAGVLFLIVGTHDMLVLNASSKSGLLIALEFVAGGAFLLNALLQWRKNR